MTPSRSAFTAGIHSAIPIGLVVIAIIGILAREHEDDVDLSSGQTLYRLREGIERFFISDMNNAAATAKAQSDIAVMWDIAIAANWNEYPSYNHVPGGGNVLYMDGHVRFIKYQEEWPTSSTWAVMFSTLADINNPHG